MARPEKWNKEQRLQILGELVEWLSCGKTLRAFCRQPGMPKNLELYRWIDAEGEEVQVRIVRARERGYDDLAEQALGIADGEIDEDEEPPADTVDEVTRHSAEDRVQRDKLRVETRLRLLAKWASGKYGDKLQVEQTGNVTFVIDTGVPVAKSRLTLTPAPLPLTGSD